MFCFQCEQAAGCKACAGNVGVCGKKADTAELQDKLTGALIGSSGLAFFPGFTLTAALRGFTYGLLLHKKKTAFPRCLATNAASNHYGLSGC